MKSAPLVSGGRVVGRVCWRERVRKCFTCGRAGAELTCDGCDHVLGACCSVSPVEGLDFCPKCFEPAYAYWTKHYDHTEQLGSRVRQMMREERRTAFRAWARESAWQFLQLSKPRTKKSLKEGPNMQVDVPAHIDPMTPPPGEPE